MPKATKPGGAPLAHLTDARFIKDRKGLILYIEDSGRHYYQRIDLRRSGAGLTTYSETYGTVLFARGVKHLPATGDAPFMHTVRHGVGVFTTSRDLAKTLVLLLWGQEVSLTDWPAVEGVQVAQSHLNAAD